VGSADGHSDQEIVGPLSGYGHDVDRIRSTLFESGIRQAEVCRMSNDGKRRRNGYLYTPFGGGDALKSALGENMARIANNKQPMGLIAPSHQAADRLAHSSNHPLSGFGDGSVSESRRDDRAAAPASQRSLQQYPCRSAHGLHIRARAMNHSPKRTTANGGLRIESRRLHP
jgi:hypothetical protein